MVILTGQGAGRRLAAIGALSLLAAGQPASAADIGIDASGKRQQMLGFGTQVWTASLSEESYRDLAGLKMKYVRLSVLPNLTNVQVPLGLSAEGYEDLIRGTLLNRQKEQEIVSVFRKLRELGLKIVLVNWAAPDSWEEGRGDLRMEAVDSLANLWLGNLAYLKKIDALPDYIEILNEPHGRWGTHMLPKSYAGLADRIHRGMKSRGFAGVQIMGPVTGPKPGVAYIDALSGLQPDTISAWSAHKYEKETHDPEEQLYVGRFVKRSREAGNKQVFLTEFSTKKVDFDGRHYADNDDAGQPESKAVTAHGYAIRVAQNAISNFNGGVNSMFYWEYQDQSWSKKNWGMLDSRGNKRPVYHALRLFTTNVPVGGHLVSSQENDPDIDVAAFISGKEVTVFAVNEAKGRLSRKIRFSGLACAPAAVRAHTWSKKGASSADLALAPGNSLDAEFEAQSVAVIRLSGCR